MMPAKTNFKDLKNLFDDLFYIGNGTINTNNILTLSSNSFEEIFDENKLIFILNNIADIQKEYRDNARNLPILESYLKKSSDGRIKVKYYQKDNELYGRYYAKNSLSAQNMVREVRHTIFNNYYIDIDISNCHPNIILWMCDNLGIKYNYLNQYINDRDNIIEDLLAINKDKDKEYIKQTILSINNGGVNHFKSIKKTEFIKAYNKELKEIRDSICEKFFNITNKVKQLNNIINDDKDNLNGKTISNICCFVENQMLLIIFNYLKKHLKKEEFNQSILCFDGIMLRDNISYDINKYISDIELLFKKLGFLKLKLMKKEMKPIDLSKYGFDPKITYKLESKIINKNDDFIIVQDNNNSFPDDGYYLNDLYKYFDNGCWEYGDEEPLNYLIENLPRVMAIIDSNIVVKINNEEFFKILKFKEFSTQLIHFTVERPNKTIEDKYEPLWKYINKNKKYFKLFNKIEANFDFNIQEPNTFMASRVYKAKIIPEYDIKDLEILFDFMQNKLMSGCKDMFDFELKKLSILCKHPEKKLGIIAVMISKQGTGKTMYSDFLCNMFGRYNCIDNMNGIELLTNSDKNFEQFGKKMIVINEMSATKDSFISNFDKLKSLATESSQRFRPLYSNAFYAKTSSIYYLLSNKLNSFIMESIDDRRPQVFDISNDHANNKEYFSMLNKYLNDDLIDKFYTYLMNMDVTYDEFMCLKIPMSETRKDIVQISNAHNIYLDFLNTYKSKNPDVSAVLCKELFIEFKKFIVKNDLNNACTQNKFTIELKKLYIKQKLSNSKKYYVI